MLPRSLAVGVVLSLGVVCSGFAQYSGGGGGGYGGGMGGMRGRHGMMGGMGGGRGGMKQLDPVVADGPPAPAEFARITGAEDTVRYAHLYDNFKTSTQPQRDSLAAARKAMRDAFEDRDRDAATSEASVVKSLGDDLSRRQQTFDDAAKEMVTKDEWKKYQSWRDDQRKAAQERRGAMMGRGRSGGAPPDDGSGDQ